MGVLLDMFKEGTKALAEAAKVSKQAADVVAEELFDNVKKVQEFSSEIYKDMSPGESDGFIPKSKK